MSVMWKKLSLICVKNLGSRHRLPLTRVFGLGIIKFVLLVCMLVGKELFMYKIVVFFLNFCPYFFYKTIFASIFRYVTTHGLALNCNVDLNWYKHIIPCGIEDKGITSLSNELHRDVTIEEVAPELIKSFSKIFQCDFCNFPEEEIDAISKELSTN